jgi:hypothetical protein
MVLDDYEMTKWLLSKGASPNARCDFDITPLSIAVQSASPQIIELLFEYGGSVDYGQLLHNAALRSKEDRLGILKRLLSKYLPQQPPPVNKIMFQGHPKRYYWYSVIGIGTPLHSAAPDGDLAAVKFLVENGADPGIKNAKGFTVIEQTERSFKAVTERAGTEDTRMVSTKGGAKCAKKLESIQYTEIVQFLRSVKMWSRALISLDKTFCCLCRLVVYLCIYVSDGRSFLVSNHSPLERCKLKSGHNRRPVDNIWSAWSVRR